MLDLFLYGLSILSLSTSAVLVRWAGAPVEIFGFWRLLATALVILPFALKASDLKFHLRKPRKEFYIVILSGLLFFAHLWTFFYSAQNTRIANCMIIFSVNPLFVALGSFLFLKDKLTWRIFMAYVFAAWGLYKLFSHSLDFEQGLMKGDLASLLSAVLFAGYLVTGKRARQSVANSEYTLIIYSLTAFLFGIASFTSKVEFWNYPSVTWLAIVLSVIFPTLLGHVLFSYLMKRMNLNLMSCGKLIEPVFSAVLAYFIFQEELTYTAGGAFLFTSIALLILFLPWRKRDLSTKT